MFYNRLSFIGSDGAGDFSQYPLTAAPLTLCELAIQGHHLDVETSTRARQTDTEKNSERARESGTIYFFLFPPAFHC